MRTSAWITFGLLVLIVACRTAPTPEPLSNTMPPPVEVKIDLDAKTRERLSIGLPMHLELRVTSPSTAVGTCTMSFDPWEENYRVALSRTEIMHVKDPTDGLRTCVDMGKVYAARRDALARGQAFSRVIVVREVEPKRPLYEPPAPYPIF